MQVKLSASVGKKDAYWAVGRSRAREKQDRAVESFTDVYIVPGVAWQRSGNGADGCVRDHLAPYDLRRILLITSDAHVVDVVYAKAGFALLTNPDKWMTFGAQ